MTIKVGGIPLILSMFNWHFRSQDSPSRWQKNLLDWYSQINLKLLKQWLMPSSSLKTIELFVLIMILFAWVISLLKELG
jgi:hypothetical protein